MHVRRCIYVTYSSICLVKGLAHSNHQTGIGWCGEFGRAGEVFSRGGGYRREKRKRGKKGYADRKKKDMQIGKKGRELVRKKRRGKKRRE